MLRLDQKIAAATVVVAFAAPTTALADLVFATGASMAATGGTPGNPTVQYCPALSPAEG